MKILKDLLFTKNNVSLDIARLSALGSITAFWTAVFMSIHRGFDAVAVGTGCAAIMGGAAAWMFQRAKAETGKEGEE